MKAIVILLSLLASSLALANTSLHLQATSEVKPLTPGQSEVVQYTLSVPSSASDPVTLGSVSAASTPAGFVTLQNTGCPSKLTLTPGGAGCQFSATITAPKTPGVSKLTVVISAAGQDAILPSAPAVTTRLTQSITVNSPSSNVLEITPIGTLPTIYTANSVVTAQFKVSNTSDAPVIMMASNSVPVTQPSQGTLTESTSCNGAQLAKAGSAGDFCQVTLTYSNSATSGLETAAMSLQAKGASGQVSNTEAYSLFPNGISVSDNLGNGEPSHLSISPAAFLSGADPQQKEVVYTIKNASTEPVTNPGWVASSSNLFTQVSSTCGASLAGGQSCQITLNYDQGLQADYQSPVQTLQFNVDVGGQSISINKALKVFIPATATYNRDGVYTQIFQGKHSTMLTDHSIRVSLKNFDNKQGHRLYIHGLTLNYPDVLLKKTDRLGGRCHTSPGGSYVDVAAGAECRFYFHIIRHEGNGRDNLILKEDNANQSIFNTPIELKIT